MISCPSCGGNLKYDIAKAKMQCGFCNGLYDPYDFDKKDKDAEQQKTFEATVYTCPQCGGELLTESENEAAAFCSFCGASTIMYQKLQKELRPNYIIPFMKTKEDCKEAYLNKAKKAIYAPSGLRDRKYIDSFRAIYMPYWSYNVIQEGHINILAEKSERKGDYIITDHYRFEAEIDASYDGIDYDASSSFDDNISEKLVPFNLEDAKEFTPGFLSGFYADTADVQLKTYQDEAVKFAKDVSLDRIMKEPELAGYLVSSSTEDDKKDQIPSEIVSVNRTMYPVWFMSYRNHDRVAYATVNGQTGKVIADFPMDIKKYIAGSLIVAIPIFLILNMLLTIKPSTALTISLIVMLVAGVISLINSGLLKKHESGENDKGKVATKKVTKEDKKAGITIRSIIVAICVCIGVLVRIINPFNDWIVYSACLIAALGIITMFTGIVKNYNLIATRPLPQFNRKGGDDNA